MQLIQRKKAKMKNDTEVFVDTTRIGRKGEIINSRSTQNIEAVILTDVEKITREKLILKT